MNTNSEQDLQDTKKPSKSKGKVQILINPDIMLNELVAKFPQLEKVLVNEFGFHCVHCFLADIETLAEGAVTHGIVDEDFDSLMKRVHEVVNQG